MGKAKFVRYPVVILLFAARLHTVHADTIPQWGVFELSLKAGISYDNPYLEMPGDNSSPGFVVGTFTGPDGLTIVIDGFFSGGDTWTIRMAPTVTGTWTYTTFSADPGLNARAGSFICVPSSNKGFIEIDPEHPHHFRWADGAPFPFSMAAMNVHSYDGTSPGLFKYGGATFDGSFQAHVNARVSQGFTAMHWGMLIGKWARFCGCCEWGTYCCSACGCCQVNESGTAFLNEDLDRLNTAYFDSADQRVGYAAAAGILPGLGIVWPDSLPAGWSHERLKRIWRYIIARYAAYNVIWNLFGEGYEWAGDAVAVNRDYGELTRRCDPYNHPITVHTAPSGVLDDDWLDFIELQEPTLCTSDALRHGKPVVNAEYGGYEGVDVTAEALRPLIWDVRMRGGYFVYETWLGDVALPGAEYSRINNVFFRDRTRFWLLEYHPEFFQGEPGLADPGREYVTYLPAGGEVVVDLSGASCIFKTEWYNPRTGAVLAGDATAGGTLLGFTAPTTDDWVLHVYRTPGDFDGDGDVDLKELGQFQCCFGGIECSPAHSCPPGSDTDLDGDGDVDLIDFSLFARSFCQ